jgi:PTS system nitrogen regulatory IIA component
MLANLAPCQIYGGLSPSRRRRIRITSARNRPIIRARKRRCALQQFQYVMTNLSKILSIESVLLDLEVSSKKRAFEQAGLIFENNHGIARSTVSDNLFARERLGSTGLGHGVAVPHGRVKGSKSLKAPLAAFVRLVEPIPFESPDGEPVSLLFFLLIPDHVTQQHLEILSEIAEFFSDEAIRAALLTDPDPQAVYQRIINWQPSLQAMG